MARIKSFTLYKNNKRRSRAVARSLINRVDIFKQDNEYNALLGRYERREITLSQLEKLDPVNKSKPENRSLFHLILRGSEK